MKIKSLTYSQQIQSSLKVERAVLYHDFKLIQVYTNLENDR